MPEGSPQEYEQAKLAEMQGVTLDYEDPGARKVHAVVSSILHDANRFHELIEGEGHQNTANDLAALTVQIVAEQVETTNGEPQGLPR